MNILETVKQICRVKGLSLADVACKMGVPASSLSQILRGNPTLSKLSDIANALNVPVAELLSEGNTRAQVECPHCGKSFALDIQAAKEVPEHGEA